MDGKVWRRTFFEQDFPVLPCPTCRHGRVVIDKTTLILSEPQHVKAARSHEAWDPTWDAGSFVAVLRCSHPDCGETVSIAGAYQYEMYVDDDWGWAAGPELRPQSMSPAPPLIAVPEDCPAEIGVPLKQAFALFWMDLGASANRLRASVEKLLDHFAVPRQVQAAGKTKLTMLNLAGRIAEFRKTQPDRAEALEALREVGNVGSHEADVEWQVLLDAFQIYEYSLAELIGQRTKIMKDLAQKIRDGKGRYYRKSADCS